MRGNSTDVASAVEAYDPLDLVVDSVASTSRGTTVSPGNEAMGRSSAWVMWRATLDKGMCDAVYMTCNMSSFVIAFTMQIPDGNQRTKTSSYD